MNINTIYYLVPDIYSGKIRYTELIKAFMKGKAQSYLSNKKSNPSKAVGGIKVMYQHIEILNRNGFNAVALKMGEYEGNVFDLPVRFVDFNKIKNSIKSNDVVVSTEFSPYDGLNFPNAYKLMFMQNWINIKSRLHEKDQDKSYFDLGYDEVMTCGDYCTKQVSDIMKIPAATLTNGIDHKIFFPNEKARIPGRVLVLSRKNYQDFLKIRDSLDIPVDFRVIDGLTQQEIVKEYQQADIFLATGYPEGFGLPPLEAMSCGCVVVGFTGVGALEYMLHDDTALAAPDGDTSQAAAHLKRVLTNLDLKERLRMAGHAKSREYSLAMMESKVVNYFKQINERIMQSRQKES